MMTFVEDDALGPLSGFAPARGVDHDQRMIGDDDVGVRARPG